MHSWSYRCLVGLWFRVDCSHERFKLSPLVDHAACKRDLLAFKVLCTMEWEGKKFSDLWGMITWNHALQARYPNLLVLVELAHVQCDTRAMCERAFSVQNLIKTTVRNMLGNKNLEAMVRIALEGPDEGVDDIISDGVPLWKNDSNYRFFVCKSLFLI